ncbi:regulator of G protein signaling superfamily [Acaromyces ingoldii]|uniref:Regulator of G protein signaling superfamily n=1 Tax=Acaromyces ingoldii TaxID=215250 RepID=A0A316YQF3_9BASI|nr:regulator of G protein signaling superfamily [Acaromyces ingoldii]PWN91246.1 regulator of G protein signaling superfamily [Acaromyces ingoldii]
MDRISRFSQYLRPQRPAPQPEPDAQAAYESEKRPEEQQEILQGEREASPQPLVPKDHEQVQEQVQDRDALRKRQTRRSLILTTSASRKRLPTLAEVLARRTLPPVDLYCYYLYLQREGSEDALDFWLDVQQHENLCRAYFKDLRRSGKSIRDDWPGYYQEARQRGSIYNRFNGIEHDGGSQVEEVNDPEHQSSIAHDNAGPMSSSHGHREAAAAALSSSHGHEQAPGIEASSHGHDRPASRASDGEWKKFEDEPTSGPRFPGDPEYQMRQSTDRAERRSILAKRGSHAPTVIARNTAITKADLVGSAERIYARFLLPGSEKEIYLPPQLRINSFPISSSTVPGPHDTEQQQALAKVPDMFHAQKEYVFRTMEADVFPRFLRAKAFGNLTPVSALVRLSLGLLALWAGLATGFSFIFLDVNRVKRLWVILPFAIAVFLIMSHQYELDPILAIAQQSETTPFHLIRIKEPYVRNLLLQRTAGVLLIVTLITAALTVLFVFVPGHRL